MRSSSITGRPPDDPRTPDLPGAPAAVFYPAADAAEARQRAYDKVLSGYVQASAALRPEAVAHLSRPTGLREDRRPVHLRVPERDREVARCRPAHSQPSPHRHQVVL